MNELEHVIGYEFNNKALLENALTHSSYSGEAGMPYKSNNERLEFIGDAYLDAIVGERLFELMPEVREGVLSRDRSFVVCEDSLAEIAETICLGDHIRLGRGEEASGGRHKASILADALEALLGAVFIDGGFEAVRRITLELMSEKIKLASEGKLDNDYKSRLQEKIQSEKRGIKIRYSLIGTSGPDHEKEFTVNVLADDNILGTGTGKSKAKAEQAAAHDALLKGDLQFVF